MDHTSLCRLNGLFKVAFRIVPDTFCGTAAPSPISSGAFVFSTNNFSYFALESASCSSNLAGRGGRFACNGSPFVRNSCCRQVEYRPHIKYKEEKNG